MPCARDKALAPGCYTEVYKSCVPKTLDNRERSTEAADTERCIVWLTNKKRSRLWYVVVAVINCFADHVYNYYSFVVINIAVTLEKKIIRRMG